MTARFARKRAALVAILAALALLVAPATVAQASPPPDGAPPVCDVSEYGYAGKMLCGYGRDSVNWGNGNIEYFVIGTNYAIFHIWKGSGGWHSLGGQTSRTDHFGVRAWHSSDQTGIETIGTDGACWDRFWPWTDGWDGCLILA